MESFVPKSLLKDVSTVSTRRMSFVPLNKVTGFSRGNKGNKLQPIADQEKELTFLYDPPLVEKEVGTVDKKDVDPESVLKRMSVDLDVGDLKLVSLVKDPDNQTPVVSRKNVVMMKLAATKLLKEIGADSNDSYPSEMHAFLAIIEEEQKIYDSVLEELVKQVTINMSERGDLLAEIRKRYSQMFLKIPRHVNHLHTELVAQRKLNKRLSEELVRAKEAVKLLLGELDYVKKHDAEITQKAHEAHEKLVSVLTQSDNTDEILEEYHKLYRMQRDRLEEALRTSEQEKRIWIDASIHLALRIGNEKNVMEILDIQKLETNRLNTLNNVIVLINDTNNTNIDSLEKKISAWRSRLITLSQSVVEEDHLNLEVLARVQREMKMLNKNLVVNEPVDPVEANHHLLNAFHLHDVKSIIELINRWADDIATISSRYTTDKDVVIQEKIGQIRKMTEIWIEDAMSNLKRNQKNSQGKDYAPMAQMLGKISIEIEDWLVKIEKRISGDDGVASQVIGLQNQVEDRYATYSVREKDKPLPASERAQLLDCLGAWVEQITSLSSNVYQLTIDILGNTTEKEQHKIPLHVENWLSSLTDQINTDTDIRNEGILFLLNSENQKLHNSVISWMVQLLAKCGQPDLQQIDNIDHEFQLLSHEVKIELIHK
jgi:hypothetical protein